MKKIKKIFPLVFSSLIVGLAIAAHAYGWTAPTQMPPNDNISTPIHAGGAGQIKSGGLTLGADFPEGSTSLALGVRNGRVGIGTLNPEAALDVEGAIVVNDVYLESINKWVSTLGGGAPAGPTAPAVSLSSSPSEIGYDSFEGASVSVNVSGSDISGCIGKGASWVTGSDLGKVSASHMVYPLNRTSDIAVTVTCSNPGGSTTASLTIKRNKNRDSDGDGLSTNAGDCDNADKNIYPGATPQYNSNKDADCNGIKEYTANVPNTTSPNAAAYLDTFCSTQKGGTFKSYDGFFYNTFGDIIIKWSSYIGATSKHYLCTDGMTWLADSGNLGDCGGNGEHGLDGYMACSYMQTETCLDDGGNSFPCGEFSTVCDQTTFPVKAQWVAWCN